MQNRLPSPVESENDGGLAVDAGRRHRRVGTHRKRGPEEIVGEGDGVDAEVEKCSAAEHGVQDA